MGYVNQMQVGMNSPFTCCSVVQERARALHRELLYEGVHVDSIHAAQTSVQRTAAVDNFRWAAWAA